MKISLLDPGLCNSGGHHLDLDLRIARAFAALGHDVEIHGHFAIEDDVLAAISAAGFSVQRSFRVYAYGMPPGGQDTIESVDECARVTAEDFARIVPGDVCFWPTFTPIQFLACVYARRPVRTVGGVWYDPDFVFTVGGEIWGNAARLAPALSLPLTIGAYDDAVQRNYRTLSGRIPIRRFPVPHDGADWTPNRSAAKTIGFFGHQRVERGLMLMPPLVDTLINQGYGVVLHDSGNALSALREHPNLTVLGRIPDFAAALAQCDLIVWPSNAKTYRGNTSGIVSESVASGIPLVMPSNCAPAERVVEIGSATFFHHFSVGAVMQAINEAVANYPALVAAARYGAELWRQREGTVRLARVVAEGS